MNKIIHKKINTVVSQQGYSMLELLVAMTLGILVLSSAVSMQVSNRDAFKSTTAQLQMKTNAKLAAEFIGTSLRNVGVMGCRTIDGYVGGQKDAGKNQSSYNISLNATTLAFADFNLGHEIQGYQSVGAGWVPTPSADLSLTNAVSGSDIVTLRGGIGESYVLLDRNEGDTQYTLDIAAGTNVLMAKNNFAVASTCKDAEVFQITTSDSAIDAGNIGRAAGGAAPGNSVGTWGLDTGGILKKGYAELRRVATVTYYVGNNAAGIPTLYRNIDGVSSALVEGVERMKIDYGIEDSELLRNVAARYLSAEQIQANCSTPLANPLIGTCLWGDVISVRVSLIMRSKEEIFGKDISKTYTLPGTDVLNYVTNDKYSRTLYSSTFVVRNRVVGNRT